MEADMSIFRNFNVRVVFVSCALFAICSGAMLLSPGEARAADGQNGDGQNGDGQNGDGQNGDGQNGDGQNGDGQNGDGQ
jgi:hypothetical protein